MEEMRKLRTELLKTSLSDAEVEAYVKKLKFTTLTKVEREEVRKQVREYVRMFNGNGFREGSNGIPAITKIGRSKRAYNQATKGKIAVSHHGGSNIDKGVTFHEITHSVEAQNPWMGRFAREWAENKAYDTDSGFASIRKVAPNVSRYSGRGVPGFNKEIFRLRDIFKKGNNYRASERAWIDDYINPYMGKYYPSTDWDKYSNSSIKGEVIMTEVWTMGVEHFVDANKMLKLYSKHPDLFEMIVGMSKVMP